MRVDLPRTIFTGEAHSLAGRHGETHAREHRHAKEFLPDVFEFNHARARNLVRSESVRAAARMTPPFTMVTV